MSVPGVTVEIGFDTGGAKQSLGTVYDDVVWTDVTQYVRAKEGVVFSRGRAEAGQTAVAGQLSVTFDNTDGRFTPGTTGGAYGRVRTRMPIRVKSGSTVLWLGFITDVDWKLEGGHPLVSMSASDIIAAAARTKCGPWLTKRTLALSPAGYWPFTDTAPNSLENNTQTAVPAINGESARALVGAGATVAGDTAGSLSFNVTSDVSPDPTVEPVFAFTPSSGSGRYIYTTATLDATGDLAVSMWVRPTSSVSVCLLAAKYAGTGVNTFSLHTESDGTLRVAGAYSGGASVTFGGVTDDTWQHIYLQRDNSASAPASRFRLWVNGSERTGTASSTMTADETNTGLELSIGGDWLTGINDFNGQLAHIALWTSLDTSRAVFLADNGGAGVRNCASRMAEVHYLTPNPTGLPSWITTSDDIDNTVSQQAANGKSLLAVCEEIADAERGSIIATREGKLKLLAQRWFIAPDAVSVTLSAESNVLSLANTFGIDDSTNLNECVVTLQPSGWRYTATRTDDPGVESTTIDVWSSDQYFAGSLARQTANAATERPRAPILTLSMDQLATDSLDGEVLALELGDTIAVTDLPAVAPEDELTLQVRAIGHDISAAGWLVSTATDHPLYGAVLDDAIRGVLGESTYLGV